MHLAFLSSEYPGISVRTGGIGVSIMNLANTYVKMGHHVSVFIYGMKSDAKYFQNGIHFMSIKNPKITGLSWLLLRMKLKKIILDIHQRTKIDFIEIPDWCGISAFLKFPFPIILKCNGSDAYFCHLDSRKPKFFNFFLEKTAFKNADYVFCVSSFCAEISKTIFNSTRKTYLIRNGFDSSICNHIPKTIQKDNSIQTVLYFGTLIRKKGVLELPEIFESVLRKKQKVRFLLVGFDSADQFTGNASTFHLFNELCSPDVKNATKYLGVKNQLEVFDLITEADVCVFPSFAEAFPLSWMEAMYLMKPIVASNIGWSKELIDHNINGFLADPKNHQLFANYICYLIDNPEQAKQMGLAAKEKVIDFFEVGKIASQQIDLFLKLKQQL